MGYVGDQDGQAIAEVMQSIRKQCKAVGENTANYFCRCDHKIQGRNDQQLPAAQVFMMMLMLQFLVISYWIKIKI